MLQSFASTDRTPPTPAPTSPVITGAGPGLGPCFGISEVPANRWMGRWSG